MRHWWNWCRALVDFNIGKFMTVECPSQRLHGDVTRVRPLRLGKSTFSLFSPLCYKPPHFTICLFLAASSCPSREPLSAGPSTAPGRVWRHQLSALQSSPSLALLPPSALFHHPRAPFAPASPVAPFAPSRRLFPPVPKCEDPVLNFWTFVLFFTFFILKHVMLGLFCNCRLADGCPL